MMSRRLGLSPDLRLGGGASAPVVPPPDYLFRHDFADDEAGGSRTSPGEVGSLVITDTGTTMIMSSGRMQWSTMAVSSVNPRAIVQDIQARAPGRAIMGILNNLGRAFYGWDSINTRSPQGQAFFIVGNSSFYYTNPSAIAIAFLPLSSGTDYQWAVVMLPTGAAALIKGGVEHPEWHIMWIDNETSDDMYGGVGVANGLGVCTNDDLRIADLGAPFNTQTGLATFVDATPTANDTAVGEADGTMYFEWTPAAAQTLSLYMRRTDDDNCYRLDCSQAGGTIKLYRREAGVDTELDAGKTQVFNSGTRYRIAWRMFGTNIATYVNTTIKHETTTTSFNQAITGAKCAGFTSAINWQIYPYELSESGKSEIDYYANFH
jgi:hypothetical protein